MGEKEEGFKEGIEYVTARNAAEGIIEIIAGTSPDPYELASVIHEAEENYKIAKRILDNYPIELGVISGERFMLDLLRKNLDILSEGAIVIEQPARLCGCEKDYWKRKKELEEAQAGRL